MLLYVVLMWVQVVVHPAPDAGQQHAEALLVLAAYLELLVIRLAIATAIRCCIAAYLPHDGPHERAFAAATAAAAAAANGAMSALVMLVLGTRLLVPCIVGSSTEDRLSFELCALNMSRLLPA
jgi:hypothetical protein